MLWTTGSVGPRLGGYSREMVIVFANLGILPTTRIERRRVITDEDIRLFRRRMRALKRAGKPLKEWRDVEAAAAT